MKINILLDSIMEKFRISNNYLCELTNIHTSTISRYRNNQRNIGKKSFLKIYKALDNLGVDGNTLKEITKEYEHSRFKEAL